MPQYIVFINRKKSHEETLREYYQDIILGMFDAPNPYKAIKHGAEHFKVSQITIDVKAFSRSLDWEKKAALRKSEVKS